MIGHENVLHHATQLQKACGYTQDSVTVTWMPNFHDYGLVEGFIEPLYNGTPCYIMSPFAFVKRPVCWLCAISQYRGTHSQAPNFAYDLCARRITTEQREGLDLRSWTSAGNAAELINPKVLDAFHEAFAPYGLRRTTLCPAYGLAEATLLVSASPMDEDPVAIRLVASELEKHRVVQAVDDRAGSGPWWGAVAFYLQPGWRSLIRRRGFNAELTESARSGSQAAPWHRVTGSDRKRPKPPSAPERPIPAMGHTFARAI